VNEEGLVRIPRDVLEELEAVYGGWQTCETLEDVGEQERLVDRSDAAIARELLTFLACAARRRRPPTG
jgi:hypothetical protein